MSGPWLDFSAAVFEVLFTYAIPGTPECPVVLEACAGLLARLRRHDAAAHAFVRREFLRFVRELDPDAPPRRMPSELEGTDPVPHLEAIFAETQARMASEPAAAV